MAGIFGVASNRGECGNDLYLGTFYLQHRAQDYSGLFACSDGRILGNTHGGLLADSFNRAEIRSQKASHGVGSVSATREPSSGLAKYQSGTLTFDGNIANARELRERLLKEGLVFAGYHFPEDVPDSDLIASVVYREPKFEKGIERLLDWMRGDFAILSLNKDGIYAARGWGRKPLILGKKDGSYAVSSESTSFVNTGFEIVRDVMPGEVVFLDKAGIHEVAHFDLSDKIRYGTFEWIYTAYPTSIIDGRPVSEVRKGIGRLLAKRYPIKADICSPIPNSGRWHALGFQDFATGMGIRYEEVFVRYEHVGRSFTPSKKEERTDKAETKLIPVVSSIKGMRIIIVDDSIVRGVQTENQVLRLRACGAKEVHAVIACPPLMAACPYGKSTQQDNDCIARRMSIEDIRVSRGLDSLNYATVEMLEEAIGFPRDKLCLDCWGF